MRYLISGYYGEGNLGDEAILAGILQEVEGVDSHAQFTVLSFDPDDTRRRHGVSSASTSLRHPARLAELMRGHDLLISGGGSFLHEADFEQHGRSFLWREGKLRPVPYFLSVIFVARSLGLPVMWYAQGLGPLHTGAARTFASLAVSHSQVVTFRDRASADLALELGARPPLLRVVPDPAYALKAAPPERAREVMLAADLEPTRPYLAVCPRPWLGRQTYQERLLGALARVVRRWGHQVIFLPFHATQDVDLCRDLSEQLAGQLADSLSPRRGASSVAAAPLLEEPAVAVALLGGAEAVLAMRLHSGILAASGGSPVISVVYDPKVAAFAEQTAQTPWAVSVDELEGPEGEERLTEAIDDTLENAESRRVRLSTRVARLKEESGQTARLAVALARREI